MKLTTSKPSDRYTAKWTGGTTTQLAIFPTDAVYTKFNFLFRISTATVEEPESTFTFMTGVTRHLMILDGSLDINHRGRYKKHLDKFGYDIFDGEWPTTARGLVTDFNLMVREKATGKLQAIALRERQEETMIFNTRTAFSGFYMLEGSMRMIAGTHSADLKKGDFVLCEHEQEEVITHIQALEYCEVVVTTVSL